MASTQSVKNLSQISKNDDKPSAVYKKQIEILERKIRTLEKENYIIKAKYKALVGQVNGQKPAEGVENINHGRSCTITPDMFEQPHPESIYHTNQTHEDHRMTEVSPKRLDSNRSNKSIYSQSKM